MRSRWIWLVVMAPLGAHGYSEDIHALLEQRSLPELAMPGGEDPLYFGASEMDALRRAVWLAGASHPDTKIRERFLFYYPQEDRFDSWAFKDFLGFNPDRPITGIDAYGGPDGGIRRAARAPDDDRRNQDRFAHDDRRNVRRDKYGQEIPADPDQLGISALHGTPSQSYAHYGLAEVTFSTSPGVLKKEPRRWAPVEHPLSQAPHFAQLHTDLALCAAGLAKTRTLAWWLVGNAHHYLQDVANQIHTVVAIYGFFFDAKVEQLKEEVLSLGGILRSRPDFRSIGVNIVKNHHLLAEDLFARRVSEQIAGKSVDPTVSDAVLAIGRGDLALEKTLEGLGPDDEFGRLIARAVVEDASHEGAEVYELVRAAAAKGLSRVGGNYENGDDPDLFLRSEPDPAKLARFYRLQLMGFARAGSAVRRHVELFRRAMEEPGQADAAARRLVAAQVAWLDARAERLARYVPDPPRRETINWAVPGALAVAMLALVGGPFWFVMRLRRRSQRRSVSGDIKT